MKNYTRYLTLLLVLILVIQTFSLNAIALAPIDVYIEELDAASQPSKYSDTYNSGQRDVVATTLDGTGADAYYTGIYEYDTLSDKSASQILSSLRSLLTSTHTTNSSYDDCKNMAGKTDCENENGKVLLLYTSVYSTVSAANSGWNREHVWPKSLGGYETSGPGADLHHIRPSDNRVNSCRSNLKYGEVSGGKAATGGNAASGVVGGYYGSYFEPLDNVKGDVARICLYMYVRYGGSWSKCSSITNVFQSVDVLLEWCEMDPVDTWELGRNEVVEAYQGNRNVFIDYPEYAWLLFGREIPEDMVTPSGEAMGGSDGHTHTWDSGVITKSATCTVSGVKTYTCSECGSTKTETISAIGHAWNGGEITSEANCTVSGVKTYTCQNDSSHTKTEVLPPLAHTYGEWVIDTEPTEQVGGTKHRDCLVCGNTETATIPSLSHTHSYTSSAVDPTCTSKGYTLYTCSCGDSYKDNYIDETGHSYENGLCKTCGAKDPSYSEPISATDEFINTVNLLSSLTGEALYEKICEALNIYSALSSDEKSEVNQQYTALKTVIAKYNNSAASVNNDAEDIDTALIGYIAVSVASLSLALYSLLGKKII